MLSGGVGAYLSIPMVPLIGDNSKLKLIVWEKKWSRSYSVKGVCKETSVGEKTVRYGDESETGN